MGTLLLDLRAACPLTWEVSTLQMVFDAGPQSPAKVGTVHTRLSWSPNGHDSWNWVDEGGLTGAVFLPLGPPGSFDSHIIFAADAPVIMPAASASEEPSIRVYYMCAPCMRAGTAQGTAVGCRERSR